MTVALMVQQPPMCPGAWSVRHQRLKSNGRASVGCSIQTRRGDAVVAKRRVMYSSAMYEPYGECGQAEHNDGHDDNRYPSGKKFCRHDSSAGNRGAITDGAFSGLLP
jgi:hypothetical protein